LAGIGQKDFFVSRHPPTNSSFRIEMLQRKTSTHLDEVYASWHREMPTKDVSAMLLVIGLTRMGRIMDADYDRRARREHGVSGAEMRILFALRRAGRPYSRRPTDLFRALLLSSGAVTKQVDRLVAKKLVVRSQDPLHGGGFLVSLTPKGLKVATAMSESMADNSILGDVLGELDPATREAGIAFCEHLMRGVERKTQGATL
jgi:DNA-binding MarR family transcriptional regulator